MTDWVSARGAAAILADAGISRSMSRRILTAGLAGEPQRTSAASLYDASRVRDLLERPSVDVARLPAPSDRALLEVRVTPGSRPDDWSDLGNAGAVVRVHIGAAALTENRSRLMVRPPGAWFGAFTDRRLHSTAGNPWRLWVEVGGTQPEAA